MCFFPMLNCKKWKRGSKLPKVGAKIRYFQSSKKLGLFAPFQNTSKFLISAIKSQFWIFSYLCTPRHCAVLPIIFSETSKVMSKITVYDLMTICRVLLLIIGQNYINPKLLQPIVASICKVMTVKKPCVQTVSHIKVPKTRHSLLIKNSQILPNPYRTWSKSMNMVLGFFSLRSKSFKIAFFLLLLVVTTSQNLLIFGIFAIYFP